jgi:hypothetical protein
MKVIYLHGLGSSPNTKKVQLLKDVGFNVVSPIIDIDPEIAEPYLIDFIFNELGKDEERVCLCGTSLGGYWVARMQEFFSINGLLINPALYPQESLKRFNGSYKDYATGQMKDLTNVIDKYLPISEDNTAWQTFFIAVNDTPIPKFATQIKLYDSDDHQGLSFFDDVIKKIRYLDAQFEPV